MLYEYFVGGSKTNSILGSKWVYLLLTIEWFVNNKNTNNCHEEYHIFLVWPFKVYDPSLSYVG